jgi:hypothetical protein
MKPGTKILFSTILIIILVIGGCAFLMRGCLSQYDEYTQFDEAQGFHGQKGNVIVFLKEHFKVNSYSSGGGMTNISGTPYFSLETRDAATLKLLKITEFEHLDNPVLNRPKIIGCDNGEIWIYQGKLMAFDPYSHEKVCTSEKLEEINPVLKNNLPEDIKYYTYNYILGRLEITTKNAIHFQISNTFKAQKITEIENNETPEIAQLKALVKSLETERTNSSNTDYWKLHDTIYKIESLIRDKEDEFRNNKDYNQKIQDSRTRGFDYYYNELGNSALSDSIIYMLLSEKELKENTNSFYFRRTYIDDVQKSIYQAKFNSISNSSGFPSNCKISDAEALNSNISFLNGGFLENKSNLKTIQLSNPQSWLIVSSKEVGNKSKLIIQRVNVQGISIWTKELPIINFSDLVLTDENLILFTNDGEKITDSSKCNLILSINLKTGDFVMVDLGNEKN